MSGSYLREQVQNLSFNFRDYKDKWQNRFEDLKEAHDRGYTEFKKHLPKAHQTLPNDLVEDIAEMGANLMVATMALQGTPALVAIPVVLGIKKLALYLGENGGTPPAPDVSALKTRLKDIERAFRQTTEHMSDIIRKMRDKAIQLPEGATYSFDADFRSIKMTMSRILLSPLWYPPSPEATKPEKMAVPFEMRMWFIYWKHLDKTGEDLELYKMFRRLKALSWQPNGHNWDRVNSFIESDKGRKDTRGYMYYQTAYKPAIKFLVAYVQRTQAMPLRIQHKFPREVEEYLQRVFYPRVGTPYDPYVEDHLLSPATITWADVAAWNP